ncbi:hypothetical protein KEJ36_03980 [Candidatus Bathyarchaeota archaeon]|nr:hypothetical protein [Candidatus Bathyarchaeota archaeon]MBS7627955.1 hypothetical protein [Candidatus Bathyarchaeota archaeon]
MVQYRLSISKKPTLRLYRAEGSFRRPLAKATGAKAEVAKSILLRSIGLKELMRFRDGRAILEMDEDSALKVAIGLRAIMGLRMRERVVKMLEVVSSMDKGEVYWWHSLYLRIGDRAIRALRRAYL